MIGRSPRRNHSGTSSPIPTRTGPTYTMYISGYAGSSYHNLLSSTNRPFHYWHMVVHESFQTKKPIISQCPGRHSPPSIHSMTQSMPFRPGGSLKHVGL